MTDKEEEDIPSPKRFLEKGIRESEKLELTEAEKEAVYEKRIKELFPTDIADRLLPLVMEIRKSDPNFSEKFEKIVGIEKWDLEDILREKKIELMPNWYRKAIRGKEPERIDVILC